MEASKVRRDVDDGKDRDSAWAEPLRGYQGLDRLEDRREAFVSSQLAAGSTGDLWQRRVLSLATTVLIGVLCWRGRVPAFQLALWLAARLALSLSWRTATAESGSEGTDANRRPSRRLHAALAFLRGTVLGASVLLFFGRLPIGLQFVCWIALMAAITLPIHTMALDPVRVRAYAHALFVTIFGCVLYRVYTADPRLAADVLERHYEAWFLVVPLVQWLLVLRIADQVLAQARKGFELAFYKQELIHSLAERRQQAEEAVLSKNRFIATAAHDMRQPVSALSIYVDHLMEVPADQAIVMPKIARATAAVNRLFDSLFDLARIDNHQLKPRLEASDVSDVVADLRDQYEPVAQAKGVMLRVRSASVLVDTDAVLIRRMIGNLLSNAVKFTPAGKRVLLAARERSDSVVIEVWDQGIGIPSDELQRVFQEFYKIAGTAENAEGFGLGLSIVARIAHVLNIRLSVRSRLGYGTVFRLHMQRPPAPPGGLGEAPNSP